MELMDKQTAEVIRLLTRLANGDTGVVRKALLLHDRHGIDRVIEYIERHRSPPPVPPARRLEAETAQ